MTKRIESDSSVQQELEGAILQKFLEKNNITGIESNNNLLPLTNNPKVKIKPDFYSEEQHIIGEIHAHLGKLKPAQVRKVATDVLKMLMFEKDYGEEFTKYIVVCDEEEEKQLKGDSYLAEAITQYKIKVDCVDLSEKEKEKLEEAMKSQNLFKYE